MKRKATIILVAIVAFAATQSIQGQRAAQDTSVQLRVLVPQGDAKVLIDGKLTTQKGDERLYLSPPLENGYSYRYTVTARWWPNNYTEVIRTRDVEVHAGQTVQVDLRQPDPKKKDDYLIRFVPTPEEVVDAMCKLAKVTKDDVVYDLGCGDGRIVITAVSEFKAKRGVGIDIRQYLVDWSRDNAKEAKVADRVTFRQQDVLTMKDLSDASVVMMYMGEDVNLRLMPVLKSTLKPGSRIVSHDFKMGDWKPDETVTVYDEDNEEHILYLWRIKKD